MSLATAPPARLDLSFRTNDDRLVAVKWLAGDATTPIPVTSAVMTLEFDVPPPPPVTDPPTPIPAATRHVIDSTDPLNADGFIDADRFEFGQVVVHVPHSIWETISERSGNWDVVATSTTASRHTLARGVFIAEEGIE